jgi:hypothetical protein
MNPVPPMKNKRIGNKNVSVLDIIYTYIIIYIYTHIIIYIYVYVSLGAPKMGKLLLLGGDEHDFCIPEEF